MVDQLVHAITPGDHYSPQTGSAIPTVVDGLARAAQSCGERRHAVLVARDTYPDRYDSAEPIEYEQLARPSRLKHYGDLLTGPLLGMRMASRHTLAPVLGAQEGWKPSVILAHNLVELVPLIDARHRGVLYAHNDLLRTYSAAEASRTISSAELVVCVSQHLAERTRSRLKPPTRDRVVVVPNGADCNHFRPAKLRGQWRELRVVFVGRTVAYKGPDVLLQAVRKLGRDDLAVSVIGSAGFDPAASLTKYERGLRALAEQCRSEVRFIPFTPRAELAELLREHDVLVVPSRWPEPWGLTVSEGLASGLVVVASAVGGIPEAIADPDLLVPPEDASALAEVLAYFADDRKALAAASEKSRSHALAHDWSWSWKYLQQVLAG